MVESVVCHGVVHRVTVLCRVLSSLNAFTTGGNPCFTTLLEVSIGRDFGALKGLFKRGAS